MWLVISKTNPNETLEMPTEREAYDYCKMNGFKYYYEFMSISKYMERKTKQWKKQKQTLR